MYNITHKIGGLVLLIGILTKIQKGGMFMSMTILVGPSCGVGKSTLRNYLFKTKEDVVIFKTNTTRQPRPYELQQTEEEREYNFWDEKAFEKLVKDGKLFEHELITNHYYGVLRKDIEKALKDEFHYIAVVDINGAMNIKKSYPKVLTIFILPPSLEVLEERVRKRDETATEEFIQGRLNLAKTELERQDFYDHKVINDNLDETAEVIYNLIQAHNMSLKASKNSI